MAYIDAGKTLRQAGHLMRELGVGALRVRGEDGTIQGTISGDMVVRRIAAGDDPNHGDREGFTPLHFAAQEGSLEAAQVLLDHGADVDRVNRFGNTPLSTAVLNSRGPGS